MSIMEAITRKIKKVFTVETIDRFLAKFSNGKSINNLAVKILPSNLDYKKNVIRRKTINGINYDLQLCQWMEYALYFGIEDENKLPLYNLIKRDAVVFDVGVNFGETLLNFAQLAGINGKVYGFEPMNYIYKKCLHNMSLNHFKNIVIENLAISDSNQSLIINEPSNSNSGGTYVLKTIENQLTDNLVKAITLDEYIRIAKIEKVDVIKIDVEGFETNVLLGAVNTLKRHKPTLYIEVCDENLKRGNSSSIELITFLENLNYQITQPGSNIKITFENIMGYPHTDIICI